MCCRRNCRCRSCSRNCNSRNNNFNNMNTNLYTQMNNTSSNSNSSSCGSSMCANNNVFPENYLYGYAYTPNQCMNRTFTPESGLQNGTIFPELVSSYSPGQSIDFIEFLRSGGM